MAEREKLVETPNQFPRIPKEIVDRFVKEVHVKQDTQKIKERDEIRAEIEREEPFLWVAVESVVDAYKESASITAGAIAIYKLFKEFELTGFKYPRVSEDVVVALAGEYTNAENPPEDINLSFSTEKSGIELTNPVLSPYLYADENPHLMVYLTMLPDHMQIGGMLIYELKRRQFHADQLTAKFGDK